MSNPEFCAEVYKLFVEARSLRPDARQAFLDRACADRPQLRAEVESLLAHGQSDTPEHSSGSVTGRLDPPSDPAIGRWVYRRRTR
jgi:hypothetical protein